ncbi:MAG: hypothetical protein AB8H86_25740 [Polyangiales bacterium]
MLKTNDSRLLAPAHGQGVRVVPDELVLPIRLRSQGKEPLDVAAGLAERFRSTQQLVGAMEPARYRSWTEKLAGKSFGSHGVRHHAEALVLLRRALGGADFFERVQLLETLRGVLAPINDGSAVAVGIPEWRVSSPEAHREAALRLHKERVDVSCATLGVTLGEVSGSHDLVVECASPVLAYVRLNLTIQLSSAA